MNLSLKSFHASSMRLLARRIKTLLDYYELGDLPGDAGDEAIIEKLKDNINDAVDQAEEVIRQRVDKYGPY